MIVYRCVYNCMCGLCVVMYWIVCVSIASYVMIRHVCAWYCIVVLCIVLWCVCPLDYIYDGCAYVVMYCYSVCNVYACSTIMYNSNAQHTMYIYGVVLYLS